MTKHVVYEIDEEMQEWYPDKPKLWKTKQGSFETPEEAEARISAIKKTYKNIKLVIEEE